MTSRNQPRRESGQASNAESSERRSQRTTDEIRYDLGVREDIVDLRSLVSAFNYETDASVRVVMRDWLSNHVDWFNDNERLSTKASRIMEYTEISGIRPRDGKDKQLLKTFFESICDLISKDDFGEDTVMKAMCTVVHSMDVSVFKTIGFSQLEKLVCLLISKLSPEMTFSKNTFEEIKPTLEVIHQVLVVMQLIAPDERGIFGQGGFYDKIAKKTEDLKTRSYFYPFEFYAMKIERLMKLWKERARTKTKVDDTCRLRHRIFRLARLSIGLRNARTRDLNTRTVGEEIANIKKMFVASREDSINWYDVLSSFSAAISLTKQDETKIELFDEMFKVVLKAEKEVTESTEQLAVRYGIITQLCEAISQKKCAPLRERAEEVLLSYADSLMYKAWWDSAPICEAYLEALQILYSASETQDAIRTMCEDLLTRETEPLSVYLKEWLEDEGLECKLAEKEDCETSIGPSDIFDRVKKELGIQLTHQDVAKSVEDLKETYRSPRFAEVTSTFPGELNKHVGEFEHDLAYYADVSIDKNRARRLKADNIHRWQDLSAKHVNEDDQLEQHHKNELRVKKTITLEKLFQNETGSDAATDLNKVLVYGDPGSGKTSLSKKLAYDWATGKWGKEFKKVYHLQMRALRVNKDTDLTVKRKISLETAIANICFSIQKQSGDHAALVAQIGRDVQDSSTLVILDGLDECSEIGRKIEEYAVKSKSKLLLLSRPYNLQYEKGIVDREVQCLGMNDRQLERFFNKELSSDRKGEIVRKMKENHPLWRTAHIPVTAQIICHVYREQLRKGKTLEVKVDMYSMYAKMARLTWARYVQKYNQPNVDRRSVFKVLEKVAFESFKERQILINTDVVNAYAPKGAIEHALKESGLLLLEQEGHNFQFPHLTFQEFFAGRFISRHAFDATSRMKEDVLEWVSQNKYLPTSRVVLHFMTQKAFATMKVEGFAKVISMLDEDPVEILGVQHLMVKLHALEACLSRENVTAESDVLNNQHGRQIVNDTIKLSDGLSRGLTAYDLYFLQKTISPLADMTCVVQKLPGLVDNFTAAIESTYL